MIWVDLEMMARIGFERIVLRAKEYKSCEESLFVFSLGSDA
jgi:hypothetical protein